LQEDISLQIVARDYFSIDQNALERKIKQGKVPLYLSPTQMTCLKARGVPLTCLAKYIDTRRAQAVVAMEEYTVEKSAD